MPETSTPTLTPDGTTKFPAFQNNNPGNVEVDALKAYILSQAGLANGLATLDENGKLDSSQIPVNLDDVLVYPSYASLPATGETGKLYITSDVNGTYYWNGTSYQILNQSFVRYRGSLSSLPSDPQPGDWFIAASSFSSYTSGHIYLYNGSSWDDVTAVFGQFVLKTDIAQTLGQQTDKVPSNKVVDDAINAINTRVTNIEETLMGENEITVQYPDDGNYSSLMPNKVPLRALKFAEVPTFRGKSRAWNQLFNNTKLRVYDGAATISGGVITFSGDAIVDESPAFSTIGGHVHLFVFQSKNNVNGTCQMVNYHMNSPQTLEIPQSSSFITNALLFTSNGATDTFNFRVADYVSGTMEIKDEIILHDLTLIFGSGNEPSTVADAIAQLPALGQYDAYDAGSLVDTVVSGAKARARNLWDEVAEVGSIYMSTGQNEPNGNFFRSKNFIPVEIGTYYFKNNSDEIYIYRYDEDKNYLGYSQFYGPGFSFNITGETAYIRFVDVSRNTYQNNICINVSDSLNGTYTPYHAPSTLSLSEPITLKSAGSVAEVLTLETGKKTRPIGSVDLGTLSWSYYSSGGITHFYSDTLTDIKRGSNNNYVINATTPLYQCVSINVMNTETIPKTIAISSDGFLCIDDDAYTDAPTFKTAMNGVILNYELDTPTTESIDPVPYNFLGVEGGGTVETIQTQTPLIDNCLDVTYDIIPQ